MPSPSHFNLRDVVFWGSIKMKTPTKSRKGIIPIVGLVFFFIMANLTFAETTEKK
jgi:hypothetical protein